MTEKTITRSQFDALPTSDRARVAKTMTILDPARKEVPDTTTLVSVDADGVRRVFTRQTWDALPVSERARLGAGLRVEAADIEISDGNAALAAALEGKLRYEGAL